MTLQDPITAYWSRWAGEYDAQQSRRARGDGAEEVWRAVWADALGEGPLDVLDVGCGSGNAAITLAGLGHRVTGVDLAGGMLAAARAKGSAVRFLPGDAVDPPLPPGSLDAVVSRYLLWTLRQADAALAAWCRLLRPGGVVVAVDSAWFPDGAEIGDGLEGARRADFRSAYGEGAVPALPLASGDPELVLAAFRAAGLTEVTATPLPAVLDLDRRHGVSPGHRPQLQMRYRGVVPAVPPAGAPA